MEYILQKSVRSKLLLTVTIGLPNSGTSTLLQQMLNTSDITTSKGLHMRHAVLFKDSVKDEGLFVVLNSPKEVAEDMFLYCFSKFLITKQLTLSKKLIKSSTPSFSNSKVKDTFLQRIAQLHETMNCIEKEDTAVTKRTLSKLQSYINFCDININKAVNEFAYLVARKCNKSLLIFALDMMFYTIDGMNKCFDISNEYFRKYKQEELDFLQSYPVIMYFIDTIEALFLDGSSKDRVVIAGISDHQSSMSPIDKLKQYLDYVCDAIHIEKFDIVPVKKKGNESRLTFDEEDIKQMREDLIRRIRSNFGNNHYIKLKYIFLYSVLQSTGRMFMTRDEAIALAEDCDIDQDEIYKFIELFETSCFLLAIDEYIILNIQGFFQGIEEVYFISAEDEEAIREIQNGELTESTRKTVWKDDKVCKFFTDVIMQVGLAVKLSNDNLFMPSLRCKEYTTHASEDSTSLIIKFHNIRIPRHMQCKLIAGFQELNYNVQLLESSYSNVTNIWFNLDDIEIKVRFIFFPKYVEVQLDQDKVLSKTSVYNAYSYIKSICIKVFNKIRNDDIPKMKYTLGIMCPKRYDDKDKNIPHIAEFIRPTSPEHFKCQHCERHQTDCQPDWNSERILWVESFQDVHTIHNDGEYT